MTPEEVWADVQKATGGQPVKPTVTRKVTPTYPGTILPSGAPRNVTYVGDPPDGYQTGDVLTFHTPGDDGMYVFGADGSLDVQQRPTPLKVAPTSNEKDITLTVPVRQSDGTVLPVGIKVAGDPKTGVKFTDANGDYTVVGGTAAALKAISGGTAGRTVSPSSIASANATTAKLPGELAQQGATLEKTDLEIADLKRKALPQQQQLLQQAQDTVKFIGEMVANGSYTPDQADQYYKQVQDYTKAGLAGKTPYEIWKEQKDQETQRANLGADMLNQRIQSGTSLAASLNRDYAGTLTANGGILNNPGPYNPIDEAKQTVNDLGGGDRAQSIAEALLGPLMQGVGSPTPGGGGGIDSRLASILSGPAPATTDTTDTASADSALHAAVSDAMSGDTTDTGGGGDMSDLETALAGG